MDDFYRHWAEQRKADTKKNIAGGSDKGNSRTDKTKQMRGWGSGRRWRRASRTFLESGMFHFLTRMAVTEVCTFVSCHPKGIVTCEFYFLCKLYCKKKKVAKKRGCGFISYCKYFTVI